MTPRCSISIPVHGGASLTRQCLEACERSGAAAHAEIVVVDDASPDHTARFLESLGSRIRVVRHERNTGFAVACNDGARAARGELLVFLNNDATPQPGWLDALVETADAHPEAAVVGSKLLHANDTIQHAGVVICQDRYPRHVYAGFPADHPAVNRPRTFGAVTGASMLVRRAAFESVGGFDPTFVNAYEDHDLCLRLRERGHQVRYCPTSVAYHLEGATRSGRIRELDAATRRFRIRWAHRLEQDDFRYYIEDGLLGIVYGESFPFRLRVSPSR
jgi:GT2 family glycosyltransferase